MALWKRLKVLKHLWVTLFAEIFLKSFFAEVHSSPGEEMETSQGAVLYSKLTKRYEKEIGNSLRNIETQSNLGNGEKRKKNRYAKDYYVGY